MSIHVIDLVLRSPIIKDRSEVLVMIGLANWANEEGVCWPSVARLAQYARQSTRNVRYILLELQKAGLIKIDSGGGRHRSNTYHINLQALQGIRATAAPDTRQTDEDTLQDPEETMQNEDGNPAIAVASEPSSEPSENEPSRERAQGLWKGPQLDLEFGAAFQEYERTFGPLDARERDLFQDLWNDYPLADAHAYARATMQRDAHHFSLRFYEKVVRGFVYQHYEKVEGPDGKGAMETESGVAAHQPGAAQQRPRPGEPPARLGVAAPLRVLSARRPGRPDPDGDPGRDLGGRPGD